MARLNPASFWDSLQHPSAEKLDATENKLLKVSLKYRIFSARIAVHESLLPKNAPDCDTFATVDGQFYCNYENLAEKLKDSKVFREEDGEIDDRMLYGIRLGSGGSRIYLYSLGTADPKLSAFVGILRPLAERNSISLIYRHIVKRDCVDETEKGLPGFGLELEVKEYGRQPKVIQSPLGKVQLAAPISEDFENMGVNLVEAVINAEDPLDAFSFISENSPMLSNHLSRLKHSEEILEKVVNLSKHFNLPENMISINGFDVAPSNLNLQVLTEFLLDYKALINQYLSPFKSIITQHVLAQKIMASALGASVIRFDVRNPSLIFLNNLEKDARYGYWPRTLQVLLRPARGQFYPIARNVVLLTVMVDIDHLPIKMIQDIANIVAQMVPLQASLVLYSSSLDQKTLSAYYAIFRKLGPSALIDFIIRVSRIWSSSDYWLASS